jgi:acetate kinase
MMLLTVNSGSTSVKLALYQADGSAAPRRVSAEQHKGTGLDPGAVLGDFAGRLSEPPAAIAHRVVHGGTRFLKPTRIDESVLTGIEELAPLAPLHNPAALRWLRAAQKIWRDTPQVAVFDTAFFASLPRLASEYAIAPQLAAEHGVRRYGFHGLAHEAMWRAWCAQHPQLPQGGRLITLQLGGGCSVTAFAHGRPVDTSMGFSPLEGLVMATRCGDIDAAIVPYLQRRLQQSADEIVALFNQQAGLKGLSGSDANPEALLASADPPSQFAAELYCYRIRKYVGSYLAVLGGCDGIVFGGGVGEHAPGVRTRALAGLEWAGIELDPDANRAARGGDAAISAPSARIHVQVIATDEESVLAAAAAALMRGGDSAAPA